MFATPPPPPHYHTYYTPTRSSPLAASSSMPNMNMSFSSPIPQSQFSFATPSPQHQQQQQQHLTSTTTSTSTPTTPANNTKATPYAQRYAATIANPLNTARRSGSVRSGGTSPTARATRRNLFLNRIKEDRDAGRFEARGEQLVLMEDAAEEKKWRESMARRAERYMRGFGIEDDIDNENDNDNGGMDMDMGSTAQLDEFLSQEQEMERAEMMLFLEAEGADEQQQQGQPPSLDTSISYSDDAEYDDIFADLADTVPQSQGMDMSSG